jgi:hypothetical protein
MERYFYKIVDNIDFVWKIEPVLDDPYKLNTTDFGYFVCNQKQFIPYLFQSIQDIKSRNLIDDFKEILPQVLTDDNCYFDKSIGLLHKDSYWKTLFAVRQINFLNRMSPIIFQPNINDIDIKNYNKLMSCDYHIGKKIYEAAYNYFKRLWEIDEYFSSSNLDTMDKFLKTIQLQAIYIRQNDENRDNIFFAFRPSWDEEHGLQIILNLETFEVAIDE